MSSPVNEKVYTEHQTVLGVALGGPRADAYCFWKTSSALGKPRQARNAAILMIEVLIIIFAAMSFPFRHCPQRCLLGPANWINLRNSP